MLMDELINNYKSARSVFIQAVDHFPVEKRTEALFGSWSLKDILAHITAWEKASVQKVNDIVVGKEPVWIDNVEKFNEQTAKEKSPESWKNIYQEFIKTGEEMIKIYGDLPKELWDKQAGPNPKFTPRRFLEAETSHYKGDHLTQVRQFLL